MTWTHKKYPKRKYTGNYLRDKKGQRVFELHHFDVNLKYHFITFESWQAAKALGWVAR